MEKIIEKTDIAEVKFSSNLNQEELEKPRIVVCYITEKDSEALELSIKSVIRYVDHIYVIFSPNDEFTPLVLEKFKEITPEPKISIIVSHYDHESKGADGKQRNKYLDLLKKQEMGNWCLVLDSDEIVEEGNKIKELIKAADKENLDCLSPRIRHLFWNFSQEDATVPTHYVLARLFKINENLNYDEVEHPVLKGTKKHMYTNDLIIWHLSDARQMFIVRKKYLNNMEKNNIHTPQYLKWWLYSRLLGEYPTKKVFPEELPQILREHFFLDDFFLSYRRLIKMGEYISAKGGH